MEFDAYSGNPADAGSMIGHVRAHPKAWPRTDPVLSKRTNLGNANGISARKANIRAANPRESKDRGLKLAEARRVAAPGLPHISAGL